MKRVNQVRILHIMSSYGGGISTFIHNLATEMSKYHIVFDVVTYNDCPEHFVKAIRQTGGDVYQLKNPKKSGWSAFKHSISRVLKLYDYHVVHCHITGYRAGIYWSMVRRFSPQSKFVIHAHYIATMPEHPVQRIGYFMTQQLNRSLSDLYVGCSYQAIESIFGYQVSKSQGIIIPNSIDESKFLYSKEQYQTLREQWRGYFEIESDQYVIGQIGRLAKIKNHKLTLQIAQLAKEKHLPYRFIFFGQGPMESELKTMIEEYQLEDFVVLAGRYEQMDQIFPMLDATILPSFNEGLGTVAIESQAGGIPVVLSENVPAEADLGMGLVYRQNLTAPIEFWLESLQTAMTHQPVPVEERSYALTRSKYTNHQAARVYASSIAGVIKI